MADGYRCEACGHASIRWFGRCPGCGAWSTAVAPKRSDAPDVEVVELAALTGAARRLSTGEPEVDRVLGGGLVRGSTVLLAGEPGIGKSTLALQLLTGADVPALLVSAEESLEQVAARARRLGIRDGRRLHAVQASDPAAAVAAVGRTGAAIVVVDSVQALSDPACEGIAGGVNQVRACAEALVRAARSTGAAVVMVGHVTKDGAVAGPKTLEHMVDVVLALEGERGDAMRFLRALKNRFGACDETGLFEMGPGGLAAVADPSALLLEGRRAGAAGSAVYCALHGSRAVLGEVQALVTSAGAEGGHRTAVGVAPSRLALVLGVLAERAEMRLGQRQVFVATAGGTALREPAGDLALCLALASAATDAPVDPDVVAVGEVGLGGELRAVPGIARRLREARRMGFERALVPPGCCGGADARLRVEEVCDVRAALTLLWPRRRYRVVSGA